MNITFADAADFYVSLGWKVLVLAAGSKVPAIKGGAGFKDATDDSATVDKWAKTYPKANIGVATGSSSGIIVIDIDPRNGGFDSVAKLAGKGMVFPPAPEARTGNNGRHLIFAYNPSIKASKDRLGPGIDVKTDGGYIVAAPSVIAKSDSGPGGEYRWVREPVKSLPRLPAWAIEALRPKARPVPKFERVATSDTARRSLEGMASRLAGSAKGHRNNLLNWAAYTAGQLIRQGKIGSGEVEARLMQAAMSSGLTFPEAKATIDSGLRAALGDSA